MPHHLGTTAVAVARGSCFEASIIRGLTDVGLRATLFDPASLDVSSFEDLIVVAAAWGDDFGLFRSVETALPEGRGTLIPVDLLHDRIFIGPTLARGNAGCCRCLFQQRHDHGLPIARPVHMLRNVSAESIEAHFDRMTSDIIIRLIVAFVYDCAEEPRDERLAAGRSCRLDVASLEVTRRVGVPQAGCDSCAPRTVDTSAGARIRLQSRPKRSPREYRLFDAALRYGEVSETLLDADEGPVRALVHDTNFTSRAVACASLSISERKSVETAFGRALTVPAARRTAVLEMLERYAELLPRSKTTTVSGSYSQLSHQAVDPRRLGVFTDEEYARARPRLVPYSADLQTDWVWAFDLTTDQSILVPEQCAYYLVTGAHQTANFVAESSSGGALGSCLEEAVLHGLFELLERDAALLTWYTGRQPARIDLTGIQDPGMCALIARWRRTGYEVIAFDITTEIGVPCVWIMVINPSGKGFYSASCTGAHANAQNAIAAAFNEVASLVDQLLFPEAEAAREHARALLQNPHDARTIADHTMMYAQPECAPRLEFLLQSRETITLAEMNERADTLRTADLRDDLHALLARFAAENMNVLVVDQTARLHTRIGASTVRTLVPGLLPIAFGYPWCRGRDFERLVTVPAKLAWRCVFNAATGALNPHPHPLW